MGEIIKDWTGIVAAIMAVAAFVVSVFALKVSNDAFKLTKAQDDRHRPNLVPYLQECHFVTLPDGDGRGYSFNLSISNRSDADNATAEIALHVTYMVGDVPLTAKVPPRSDPRPGVLVIPSKLAAHDTISGWVHFHMEKDVVREALIEGYSVVITDTHGETSAVEPQILRERHNASAA